MLQVSVPLLDSIILWVYGGGGGIKFKGHPKEDLSGIFVIYHNDIGVLFHAHR